MWLSEMQSVGLTGFGVFFMFLGMLLLFDSGLLAIGNILFLCGIILIIGISKTFAFFGRRQKWKGTVCFLGGILLVFCKWPVLGMGVEGFGFLNLFGFMRRLPLIGTVLNLPVVKQVVDRIGGKRLPV